MPAEKGKGGDGILPSTKSRAGPNSPVSSLEPFLFLALFLGKTKGVLSHWCYRVSVFDQPEFKCSDMLILIPDLRTDGHLELYLVMRVQGSS